MAAPTRWPLPLALDDSADRHWIGWQVARSGSVGWRGAGSRRQARLTVTGDSDDVAQLRLRVGAGSVALDGYRSRFETTGNGLTMLLIRAVWDVLNALEGRRVYDALASKAWQDPNYCAFPRCPAAASIGAAGFCEFHVAVWCRAHARPLPGGPVPDRPPKPETARPKPATATVAGPAGCVCGDLFESVAHGPDAAHRRRLCDPCRSHMTRTHRELRPLLSASPTTEWVQMVGGRFGDAPLPGLAALDSRRPGTEAPDQPKTP